MRNLPSQDNEETHRDKLSGQSGMRTGDFSVRTAKLVTDSNKAVSVTEGK